MTNIFKQVLMSNLLTLTFLSSPLSAYELPPADGQSLDSDSLEVLRQMSKGVSELAEHARQAVVFVSVSKTVKTMPLDQMHPFEFFFGPQLRQRRPQRKQEGIGSGFIVDLKEGYVITNNHVIADADEISLTLSNGQEEAAKVLGRDKNTDVAVVQIINKDFKRDNLKALILGNSDKTRVGQFVVAIGAPFGLKSSVSFGVLSARSRDDLRITAISDFLQTDAAINPGNSGGPLIDANGHVVGMNTAIYSKSGSSAGIGFAASSNLVRNIANQLIENGEVARGYLGIRLQGLEEDIASGLGLPKDTQGVLVAFIQPNTPAEKAGLQDGDVITAIDNKKVKTPSELTNAVGLKSPGSKVKITFIRSGKTRHTTASLMAFPQDTSVAQKSDNNKATKSTAGLKLQALTPGSQSSTNLKERFHIDSNRGLVIIDVAMDSPGDRAGLRPGDVLIRADRQPLRKVSDFRKAFQKRSKILVYLERKGDFHFVALRKD